MSKGNVLSQVARTRQHEGVSHLSHGRSGPTQQSHGIRFIFSLLTGVNRKTIIPCEGYHRRSDAARPCSPTLRPSRTHGFITTLRRGPAAAGPAELPQSGVDGRPGEPAALPAAHGPAEPTAESPPAA